jgi:hypothetical protein
MGHQERAKRVGRDFYELARTEFAGEELAHFLGPNCFNLLSHGRVSLRFQIPHRRCQICVSHPHLHRPQINATPKAAGGESGTEFVQPYGVLW